jgi:hypothetical protein
MPDEDHIGGSFSWALQQIKDGRRAQRAGWNGKGQFVFLVGGSNFAVNREPLKSILGEGTEVTYRPHIDLHAVDGTIGVWAPSMSDVLAMDWQILPADPDPAAGAAQQQLETA